jgi:hypothetical protein
MGAPSHRLARCLTVAATLVVGATVVAALAAAAWTPATPDLATAQGPTGRLVVTWVAPDGPAWSAGIRPGDIILARVAHGAAPAILAVRAVHQLLALAPQAVRLIVLDLFVVGLGLCFLALGALVGTKSPDRAAGGAYWRMSLCGGAALGFVPPGLHGLPWALVLDFTALRLFGPALLELAWVFPSEGPGWPRSEVRRYRPLVWLPALALLALYPLCWWRPAPLFSLVQIADGCVLLGYIAAACLRLGVVLRRPHSAHQRAQLQWLALGLAAGFLPFAMLTLLPLILVGHALLPAELSILFLALPPVSVAVVIVAIARSVRAHDHGPIRPPRGSPADCARRAG